MESIRIAGVAKQSITDGPGFRLTVFTQGCPHQCNHCHNPETHSFDGGYDCEVSKILDEIDRNPLLDGLTLSGGEPMCRAGELLPLVRAARSRGKDIVCFTGYTFEWLLKHADAAQRELLEEIDLLIDGPYLHPKRDLRLRFRGSSNQRVLALPQSLCEGKAVWAEGYGGTAGED